MSQSIRLSGQITQVFPPIGGVASSGKEWCKQEYVMRMDEGNGFSRHVCFSVFGKQRIQEFNLGVGDNITAFLNIDARAYKDKWYNSVECWRVERIGGTAQQSATYSQPAQQPAQQPAAQSANDDDIPF